MKKQFLIKEFNFQMYFKNIFYIMCSFFFRVTLHEAAVVTTDISVIIDGQNGIIAPFCNYTLLINYRLDQLSPKATASFPSSAKIY